MFACFTLFSKILTLFLSFFSPTFRLKRPHLDMSSKEASAILDSVQKKTKVFGCNLENYLKVSVH